MSFTGSSNLINAPVYKFYAGNGAANGGVAVWTPGTSLRVAVTGVQVTQNITGTFDLSFANVATARFFGGTLTAGTPLSVSFTTPIINSTTDQSVYFTSLSASGAYNFYVALQGYEIE